MTLNKVHNAFLQLLKATVCGSVSKKDFPALSVEEWNAVLELAEKHKLTAVAFDGVQLLPNQCMPDIDTLMEWLGQASYCETIYQQKKEVAAEFAEALARHGAKCIVMKGLGASLYYDKPEHREFGDFDCYFLKDGKPTFEVGKVVAKELCAEVSDEGSYKHEEITYNDLLIENHQYISNFDETKEGVRTEKILRERIKAEVYSKIDGTEILVPPSHFMSLHLLKHSLDDFLNEGLLMRQVYDWVVFLRTEMTHLDWKSLGQDLADCRLMRFCEVLTMIGMKYMGLQLHEGTLAVSNCDALADKVLMDTLTWTSTFGKEETTGQKMKRIFWTRFGRMWRFRGLATESYPVLIWKTFAFSSYLNRKPVLE